ncbi:MAG: hypothetical protein U1F56_16600 [Rubrivivax sp.]
MTRHSNPRRRWLAGAAAALLGAGGHAAPREVHGAHDAWAEPGIALAWGVLRGRDEAGTRVIVRIDVDPRRWARLEATGRDPFGGASVDLPMLQGDGGRYTVDVPRGRFADHPRTELRLWAPGGAEPGLLVYFAGVPDTTPEFNERARLEADLARRLEQARARAAR